MKIIPPYQITSEILNVINEAEEFLILVSPYVNFKNWDRIKQDIANAIKRGVKVSFYSRMDNDNIKSWEEIESLGLQPKLVTKLHAKLYFNEKNGIVTSMNLLTSSNLNAIEFGSIYNTKEELTELQTFVKKYLEPNVVDEKPNEDDIYIAKEKFQVVISNFLSNAFEQNVYCKWHQGCFSFNINNQYRLGIEKGRNEFWVSGVVSGKESSFFNVFKNQYNNKDFEPILFGEEGMMSSIGLVLKKPLTSDNFNQLAVWEKKKVIEGTAEFVGWLRAHKEWCREQETTANLSNV